MSATSTWNVTIVIPVRQEYPEGVFNYGNKAPIRLPVLFTLSYDYTRVALLTSFTPSKRAYLKDRSDLLFMAVRLS